MKFIESKEINLGTGKWTVTVDGKEWKDFLKKAKNKVVSNLEIPGFRKGKVPAAKAEKYVTPSKIYNEAFRMVISPAFEFARSQEVKIEPLNPPTPIPAKVSENEIIIDFVFDLKPEIKIGDYKGIKTVKKEKISVTQEEIDASIENYRSQFAMEKVRKPEEKVANGDAVIFDFEGFIDGVAFKGGEAKNHRLVIGSKEFIPGFEDSMIGLKLGKSSIQVTFPENYNEELANKKAEFKLNIKEIKSRELPKKDDEFVKDLNIPSVSTLKELEVKLKADILEQKTTSIKNNFVDEIISEIAKNSTIELPKTSIEKQLVELRKEFEEQLAKQKLDIKKYKKITGLNEDQINEELRIDAKAKLEAYLITNEIKAKENFEVTEDLLNKKYEMFAKQFQIDVEQVKSMINPQTLKSEIVSELLVDFLYQNNG